MPAFRRGFLAMPYLGVQIPVGSFGDKYSAGARVGTLLGGHITPEISLSGELTIDALNEKNVPSGDDLSVGVVDVAFSPLYHFSSDRVEVVLGPKLGIFGYTRDEKYAGQEYKSRTQGLAYGINLGAFVPVGSIAIGGLASFVGRHANKACGTPPGGTESCDTSPSGPDYKTLAFTAAVLF